MLASSTLESTKFSPNEFPIKTLTKYFNELVPKAIRKGEITAAELQPSNLKILISDRGIPLLSFLTKEAVDQLVEAVSAIENPNEKIYPISRLSRAVSYLSLPAQRMVLTMVEEIAEKHLQAKAALTSVLEELELQLKICSLPEIQNKITTAIPQLHEAVGVKVLTVEEKGNADLTSEQYDKLIKAAKEIKDPVERKHFISEELNKYEEMKLPQIWIGLAQRKAFLDVKELREVLFNKVERIDNADWQQLVVGQLANRAIHLDSDEHKHLMNLTKSFDALVNWIEGMAEANLDEGLVRQIVEKLVSCPPHCAAQLKKIEGLRLMGWNLKYVPKDLYRQVVNDMRDTPVTDQAKASTLEGFLANVDLLDKREREVVLSVFNKLIANPDPEIRVPLLSIALHVVRLTTPPATKNRSLLN